MNQKCLILLATIFFNGVYSSPVNEQQQPSGKRLFEEKSPTISSVTADRINTESVPTHVPSTDHSVPVVNNGVSQSGVHENSKINQSNTVNHPVVDLSNSSVSEHNETNSNHNTSQVTKNNIDDKTVTSPIENNASKTTETHNASASDTVPTSQNSSATSSTNSPSVAPVHPSSMTTPPTIPTAPTTVMTEKTASIKTTSTTNAPDSVTTNKVVAEHNAPSPVDGNHFDGPSFVGGIVLTIGLTAIGFIAFKYYKSGRIDMNYRTL